MRTGICEVASMHVHTGWDKHGKQEGEPLRSQRMWKNHLGHVLQKITGKILVRCSGGFRMAELGTRTRAPRANRFP